MSMLSTSTATSQSKSKLSTLSTVKCNKNDLTSIATSERYQDIAKLLEQQHRRWRQQQKRDVADADGKATAGIVVDDDDDDDDDVNNADWWAAGDGYNLDAYKQVNGVWPLGHPLPLPDWSAVHTKAVLCFDSVWQYEDLNAIIETTLQRMQEETHYNTVNLFVDFYRSFKRTRRSDLKSFYQFYDLPINRRHHMCVSMAFEIIARLIKLFPVLANYLYVVSCEEQVVQLSEYIELSEEYGLSSTQANVEKEHAMVAMKLKIAGRDGVMILDPGYHVGRAVTVMKDQAYPHTSWFNQSQEPHLQRDYCYTYSPQSPLFVEWCERELRHDQTTYKTSLVYVEKEYMTAIDVTVRRNLVYNFRSLLARDGKGRVFAGIYFPIVGNVNGAHLTLFYDGPNEQRVKVKLMFNVFRASKLPEHVQQHLNNVAAQLNMPQRELNDLCKSLAEIVADQDFITQMLGINDDIVNMSNEN